MLDKQDKKDIREIMEESLADFARDIFDPAFQTIQNQLQENKEAILENKEAIKGNKQEIMKRPTLDEFERKLHNRDSRLYDEFTKPPAERFKKLNEKGDLIAEKLTDKEIFDIEELEEIKNTNPFSLKVSTA